MGIRRPTDGTKLCRLTTPATDVALEKVKWRASAAFDLELRLFNNSEDIAKGIPDGGELDATADLLNLAAPRCAKSRQMLQSRLQFLHSPIHHNTGIASRRAGFVRVQEDVFLRLRV